MNSSRIGEKSEVIIRPVAQHEECIEAKGNEGITLLSDDIDL
jgi:hypothetical protein